jgi:hypothetical protein
MPVISRLAAAAARGYGLFGAVVAQAVDPYFEYNTLLLPGNGTNGAQNNTFLDSSTNAFSITRNGNTTQGTFSPFSQTGWGNYFDGSGDYLEPSSATNATNFGTGDFTCEFWYFPTADGQQNCLDNFGNAQVAIYRNTSKYINYYIGSDRITSTSVIANNLWWHIALVRSSGTTKLYINGSQEGSSYADSTNFSGGATYPRIGASYLNTVAVQGYISNLRIVKGTAVYTSNFTPATTPLTAITNTSLLTCQSNRFIDNSSNAFAITRNGDVSVQAFSPFNPTASWSAATNGGSGYFDGSGDYLTAPDDAFWDLSSSTGSMELFVYPAAAPSNTPGLIGQCPTTANWGSYLYSDGRIGVGIQGTSELAAAAGSLIVAAWNHIVITRDNSTSRTRLFVNGVLKATGTGTYFNNSSAALHIGYFNGYAFNGYISDVRFCKGSIPTTYQTSSTTVDASIFTPPSSPVTTSSQGATSGDTELLLSYTNAGIYDATSKNDLETLGNAQISTTQSKFGGSSMYFDATGDYLTAATNPNIAFGTGDFTIELWVYSLDVSVSERGMFQTSDTVGGLKTTYTTGVLAYFKASGEMGANVGNTAYITSGAGIAQSSWTHIAVTRYSGAVNVWVNGISRASGTGNTANLSGQNICVGGYYSTSYLLSGYINDFRITKGYARYTANFTAPTAAFPLL